MLAAIGTVLAVISGILKLVSKYPDQAAWLLVIAVILIGIDVAWGWRRAGAGYYRRAS